MSNTKRCKKCGNPVDLEVAQAHDGACPWCLAAFTFSPEPFGNPATATKDAPTQFGKYLRTEKLGAGGMGEVWKAFDTELNRWVALKFLKDEDPSSTVRFQREARTAAGLSHSGIAAIHEVGEVDGRHFIAMQYVQGRTMASFPKKDRRLLVRLFRDAARALDHAHRHGVIHRDLKPDNLMVEEREDGWHVVLLDFGLARTIEGGEKLSKSGEVYGTAAYMSPEQAKGDHLDERADVYSLGATMYEVLTGRPPFRGSNLLELLRKVEVDEPPKPRKINPRIHRDLETIILKCLEKDRERRYANARELAEDLERFLNSDPILARPPSTLYRLKLTLEKRKGVAITAAAGIVGIVVVAFLILGSHDSEKEARDRAGTKVDVARLKIDQIDQLMKDDNDRTREIELLSSAVRAELNEALRICPEHEEACFEMGRMLVLTYSGSEATEFFGRAIKLAPRQAKAYLARATQNLDFYERLRHSQGGVRIREESEKSRRVLALIMEDLNKIRSISTEVPQLKYAAGMISFAQGNFRLASEQLKEYVKHAPADVEAWVWLGHAQGHADAFEDAVQSLTRALRLQPRMPWALVLRGNAYCDSDRYEEAIADHSRALEIRPNDAVAFLNRGNAKHLKGLHDEAVSDFNRALELNPRHGGALNSRGMAKASKDLLDEAIADFTKAIDIDPKDSNPYYNRGNAKLRKRLADDAIEDYAKSIELNPKDHKAWAARGDAKKAKGLFEDALADYAQAIAMNPTYPIVYNNRGVARRERGLFAEAIPDFDQAIALNPKEAQFWGNRAGCKNHLDRLDEALADIEMCIQLE
ncbi:MAG TPA: tetratricopeptide repeat protein, partial [Planctomycetota bacterium]|nr:tetratricopeptide repeat protein [Planctomycetota bacterium]